MTFIVVGENRHIGLWMRAVLVVPQFLAACTGGAKCIWRRLAMGMILVPLISCGGQDERLQILDARIKALDGKMKLGEVREVPLPPIKRGEWIVAIAGQYGGRICTPSPLSTKVTERVNYNFGMSELYPAFLLLVSGDRVVSDMPLSIAKTPTSVRYVVIGQDMCGLIADSNHHSLVVECIKPITDKPIGHACEVALRDVK